MVMPTDSDSLMYRALLPGAPNHVYRKPVSTPCDEAGIKVRERRGHAAAHVQPNSAAHRAQVICGVPNQNDGR